MKPRQKMNRDNALILGIAMLAALVRIVAWAASHFTSEDFLITLRYARHLAAGDGLVYNPGERVLGTTTPLYTLFLALLQWLGLPAIFGGKGLNIAADSALCVLVFRWLRQVNQPRAAILAAFLVAIHPLHIQWSISGMETSLVTCCGMWAWVSYAQSRYKIAYLAAAILFLLRWDGILLAIVLTGGILCRERRLPWREIVLFALIIAPWLLGASWYYGNPIPVTAMAKSIVYGWRAQHDATWIGRHLPGLPKLGQRFLWHPAYGALSTLALIGAARSWTFIDPRLLLPIVWFALYWLAFLASRVLLFPWYLVPTLPVYEAMAAIGAVQLATWRPICRLSERLPMAPLTAVAAMIGVVGCTAATIVMARREQAVEDRVRLPIALWIRAQAKPNDTIMLEPIGYIGFYSELRILDAVGLVSPSVLTAYQPENRSPMREIARKFRPEWCVLRPGEIAHIESASSPQDRFWEAEYEPVRTFSLTEKTNIYVIYRRKVRDTR